MGVWGGVIILPDDNVHRNVIQIINISVSVVSTPFPLSVVPSAPSLGHFPCKPASSGARPGAEGQSCRWDTLDMGDTQQIYFSTTNRAAQRQTANTQGVRCDVCAA